MKELVAGVPFRIRMVPAYAASRTVPLTATSAGAPTQPAYTFGWDTAFAIRIADVNRELSKPSVCPPGFDATLPNVCRCRGEFGAWRIAVGEDGGDGTILRLAAPIPLGTLEFQGQSHDLANSRVVFEVRLAFLEHPEVKLPSGRRTTLRVDANPKANRPAVNVTDFKHPDDLVRALAIGTLPGWFNANIAAFEHVFATVDLNVVLAQNHLQWLAPSFTGYAYHNGPTEEESYLGILSMTSSPQNSGETPRISPVAIPTGRRAGFLMSAGLMMQNLMRPAMPKAFAGSSLADFAVSPDGPKIVSVNPVALQKVTHDGIDYHPVLEWMEFSVDGDGFLLNTRTRIEISPGITAYIKQSSFHQIKLVDRGDGKQTLKLYERRPAESDHYTDIAAWVKIVEDIVILIGIVVELILGVLTGGAAFLIGSIIIALLFGLAAATPELIAAIAGEGVSLKSPPIDSLVDAASATITWQGSNAFRIGSAVVSESFLMGGDPVFVR